MVESLPEELSAASAELRLVAADGTAMQVRASTLPDGRVVSTVATEAREINELLEERVADRTRQLAAAATAAEQANQTKSRFLAAASHDLLQPLNAARLFNSTLRTRASHDAQLRMLADRIENSLVAAEELLEGLLDVARLDAGTFKPRLSRFALGPMLDSLEQQFAPTARQRGIAFKVRPTRAFVHTDPRLLRRVLQNLIGNALRYTDAGKVLVGVRLRGDGSQLELQVCDTGPGIAPELHELIFEEFRRFGPQSPWGEQGLGLGLSICRRIASILGARLTLRSKPDQGSVFGICVPRAPGRMEVHTGGARIERLSERRPTRPADPARDVGLQARPAFDYSRRTSP